MEIYPAIDLYGGKAVRLLRGAYDKMTVYSDRPVELAASFREAGARFLHLVDLDGAKDGGSPNFETIREIIQTSGLAVQLGGGIRDMAAVEKYLGLGAARVIIGTAAVMEPDFLAEVVARFGPAIAVAADLRDGYLATHGWVNVSALTADDFFRRLETLGVKTVICTDISKDGAMEGICADFYRDLSAQYAMDFIASGGVSSLADIERLSISGVSGAILGKAMYIGAVSLEEAIKTAQGGGKQ